jgi:hypothetical protein
VDFVHSKIVPIQRVMVADVNFNSSTKLCEQVIAKVEIVF